METTAIAGMAMDMQAARLQQEISMGIMKMQMDTVKESGQMLVEMMKNSTQAMEKSVNPHLGQVLDILV